MTRVTVALVAALIVAGCGGGGDAVARYEAACASLPALDDLPGPPQAEPRLDAAIERIVAVEGEPAFVDAVRDIGAARGADEVAVRYRVALAAARDAGIECAGLTASELITSAGEPNEVGIAAPADLDAEELAVYEHGRLVLAQSGCLACHKVGDNGGDLGPDLTDIGARRSPEQLARVLVHPVAPMPSFRRLPAPQRADLVAFLAALDG